MAYEIAEIKQSQEIFYYLLEHHELGETDETRLYKAYTDNEQVQNLVKSQGEEARCEIEKYGSVIYLIPKEDNDFLGFSKQKLKSLLCRSGATDKDYYLSQFIILTFLVEFYDGQGNSSRTRQYMRVGELQNCISDRLRDGADGDNEESRIIYENMLHTYESLKSDEKGAKYKTTKEGFLHTILSFLQKQGLVDYVEEDEMIKPTKKLDNFMDWNLLNQNNYQRVKQVLSQQS